MTQSYELSTNSVSKSNLILEIKGKSKICIELKRHLAPRTVGIILRSLPINGNAHFLGKSIIYFESSLDSGIERARKDFKKNDIAFYPAEGSICFFVNNASTGKQMSPIGKIVSGLENLINVKSGDVLSIYENG